MWNYELDRTSKVKNTKSSRRGAKRYRVTRWLDGIRDEACASAKSWTPGGQQRNANAHSNLTRSRLKVGRVSE